MTHLMELLGNVGFSIAAVIVLAAAGVLVAEAVRRAADRREDMREGYADGLDGKRPQRGRSLAYLDAHCDGCRDARRLAGKAQHP